MEEMIVIRVPDGTKRRLENLAARRERTVSQELRLLIRELLEREDAPTH